MAEKVWQVGNANILHFLDKVEASRQYRLKYEELVSDPLPQLKSVCIFLDIPFDSAMLNPYRDKKIIQGPGDINFREKYHKIDSALATAWQKSLSLP